MFCFRHYYAICYAVLLPWTVFYGTLFHCGVYCMRLIYSDFHENRGIFRLCCKRLQCYYHHNVPFNQSSDLIAIKVMCMYEYTIILIMLLVSGCTCFVGWQMHSMVQNADHLVTIRNTRARNSRSMSVMLGYSMNRLCTLLFIHVRKEILMG